MVNYMPDPGFESGALLYQYRLVVPDVTDSSQIIDDPVIPSADGVTNNYSLRMSASANSGVSGPLVAAGWFATAEEGQAWSATCKCGYSVADTRGWMRLAFVDSDGVVLSYEDAAGSIAASEPETLVIENVVAPPVTERVRITLGLIAAVEDAVGQAVFDQAMLTKSTTAPTEFICGDGRLASWHSTQYGPTLSHAEAPSLAAIFDYVPPYWYEGGVIGYPDETLPALPLPTIPTGGVGDETDPELDSGLFPSSSVYPSATTIPTPP